MSLPSLVNLKQGILFQPIGSEAFYISLYNSNDELEWFRGNNHVLEFLKKNSIRLTKYEDYIRDNLKNYDLEYEEYDEEEEYEEEEEYDEYDEEDEEDEEEYDDEFIVNDYSVNNDVSLENTINKSIKVCTKTIPTPQKKRDTPIIVQKSTQRRQKPVQKKSNMVSKPKKSNCIGKVDEEIYFKLFTKKPRQWDDMNDIRMRLSQLSEKQKKKMKEKHLKK